MLGLAGLTQSKGELMKTLVMLIACATMIAGCAKNTETGQGGGGYNDSGTMGTSTNSNPSGTQGTQGGTGTGTQGGTTDQGTSTPRSDTGDTGGNK